MTPVLRYGLLAGVFGAALWGCGGQAGISDAAVVVRSGSAAAGDQVASRPGVVYSWVDDQGRIRMASRAQDVPAARRGRVVVNDLGKPRRERLEANLALVVDLRRSGPDGPLNYSLVDLAALSGEQRNGQAASGPGELGRRAAAALAAAARKLLGVRLERFRPVQVVLYMAPWCGFCKKAAAYLREQGITFRQRDIEKDPGAAAELAGKLERAGLRGGGIPVLDIAGRLVVGFDRTRIERLLESVDTGGSP